ncbi:hypothetical protein D3C78_1123460 [compost metagenome]
MAGPLRSSRANSVESSLTEASSSSVSASSLEIFPSAQRAKIPSKSSPLVNPLSESASSGSSARRSLISFRVSALCSTPSPSKRACSSSLSVGRSSSSASSPVKRPCSKANTSPGLSARLRNISFLREACHTGTFRERGRSACCS